MQPTITHETHTIRLRNGLFDLMPYHLRSVPGLRKKQLRDGEITKEEYLEWKLNWPQTADGCGRYEPKKKWRKE